MANSDEGRAMTDSLSVKPTSPEREALEDARQEIAVAIAFLGRDEGTKRLDQTANGLIERLVKTEAKITAVLAATSVDDCAPTAAQESDGALLECARILAGLQNDDRGRRAPTLVEVAFAKRACAAADQRQADQGALKAKIPK